MNKLKFSSAADAADFQNTLNHDSKAFWPQKVKVAAKGKIYYGNAPQVRGVWHLEELRNSDEELARKFVDNVSEKLPLSRATRAADSILRMEEFSDIGELMELVSPDK